jgi:hypothetical protein
MEIKPEKMKIIINNHRKIFAIQEQFNTVFPEMKIGFFGKPNTHGGPPSAKLVMHSSRTLQDCRAITRQGTLEILPTMNLSDVKDNFRDIYGLSVEFTPKEGTVSPAAAVAEKHATGKTSKKNTV